MLYKKVSSYKTHIIRILYDSTALLIFCFRLADPDFRGAEMYTTKQMNISSTFDNSTDFLTIPDSLIAHTRDTIFSTWQIIELQLSQVDPAKDPDIYQALDCRANTLFNSWLAFRRA